MAESLAQTKEHQCSECGRKEFDARLQAIRAEREGKAAPQGCALALLAAFVAVGFARLIL
jgi:hypothetical protein